jgi:hypothetical protein
MSESTQTVLRVVQLPLDDKGKPAPNACTHLAVIDRKTKKIVRFQRMTRRALEQAENGEVALVERVRRGRLRAFLAHLNHGGPMPRL